MTLPDPVELRDPVPWQERGVCGGQTATMFPTSKMITDREPAKALCRRCPVIDECLDYALTNREIHGVWGGLSEAERRRLLRKRGVRVRSA